MKNGVNVISVLDERIRRIADSQVIAYRAKISTGCVRHMPTWSAIPQYPDATSEEEMQQREQLSVYWNEIVD